MNLYYATHHQGANAVVCNGGGQAGGSRQPTTGGNTILKKSTSGSSCTTPPTVGVSAKHATFNEVVTVFERPADSDAAPDEVPAHCAG